MAELCQNMGMSTNIRKTPRFVFYIVSLSLDRYIISQCNGFTIIDYKPWNLSWGYFQLTIMSFMVDHYFFVDLLVLVFLSLRIKYTDVCILIADFVNLLLSKTLIEFEKLINFCQIQIRPWRFLVMLLLLMITPSGPYVISGLRGYLGIQSHIQIHVQA